MKFRIKGDVVEIKKLLEVFIKICKEEYKKQIRSSKVLKMTNMLPTPVKLPDEFYMAHYYDNEGAVLGIPSSGLPRIIRGSAKKKMKKNLEGFFKAHGIKVEVEVMKDE